MRLWINSHIEAAHNSPRLKAEPAKDKGVDDGVPSQSPRVCHRIDGGPEDFRMIAQEVRTATFIIYFLL